LLRIVVALFDAIFVAVLEIKNRSLFLHVDVCGQEDGAEDAQEVFPTIQQIGGCLAAIIRLLTLPSLQAKR
jgi:hypothetical protein